MPERFTNIGRLDLLDRTSDNEENRNTVDHDAFDQGETQQVYDTQHVDYRSRDADDYSRSMSDAVNGLFDSFGKGKEVEFDLKQEKYIISQLKVN